MEKDAKNSLDSEENQYFHPKRDQAKAASFLDGRVLKFFGHIARHDNMEKLMVQGKPEGRRRRGRSPTRWTDLVEKLTESQFQVAARNAKDRRSWRNIIQEVIRNL